MWEQQLINDIGDELRDLLEPEQICSSGCSQRLMQVLEASSGRAAAESARPASSRTVAFVGATAGAGALGRCRGVTVPRPSDRVLDTRAAGAISTT